MDLYPPSTSPGTMVPGNSTSPYGNTAENDALQGSRDLAIVFALISLAIPFFVVSIRFVDILHCCAFTQMLTEEQGLPS
jgi:hypothetical protein